MLTSTHFLPDTHTHTSTHLLFLILLTDGACGLTGVAEGILCTSVLNEEGLRLVSIQYVSVTGKELRAHKSSLNICILKNEISQAEMPAHTKKCIIT